MSCSSAGRPSAVLVGLLGVALLAGCATEAEWPQSRAITGIAVGDCFDADAELTTAYVYEDCTAPHLYEAFHAVALDEGGFPGAAAVTRLGNEQCATAFGTFTGLPATANTQYDSAFLGPTAESWEAGDRLLVCMAVTADGLPRAGSAGA